MVMVIVMVVASVGFCGGGRCTVIAIMLVVSVGVQLVVMLVGHRRVWSYRLVIVVVSMVLVVVTAQEKRNGRKKSCMFIKHSKLEKKKSSTF